MARSVHDYVDTSESGMGGLCNNISQLIAVTVCIIAWSCINSYSSALFNLVIGLYMRFVLYFSGDIHDGRDNSNNRNNISISAYVFGNIRSSVDLIGVRSCGLVSVSTAISACVVQAPRLFAGPALGEGASGQSSSRAEEECSSRCMPRCRPPIRLIFVLLIGWVSGGRVGEGGKGRFLVPDQTFRNLPPPRPSR